MPSVSCISEFPAILACVWSVSTGKGLCMLTKEDCRQRAPCDGDVIYNTLFVLMNDPQVNAGLLTYYILSVKS